MSVMSLLSGKASRALALLLALGVLVSACARSPEARVPEAHAKTARGQARHVTPAPREHTRPDWQTFLLLGLDQRGKETPRSDTIIVVNWDRANDVANVLSVPRDLWVQVPGYGWYKLGQTYSLGAGQGGPGGPQLVERTLKENLGIEVDDYAAVSLESFRSIVNRIGGVWVDVPYPLMDNEYPTDDYKYKRIYFGTGLQHMDGEEALEYARSRHEDGDFGRSRRQQQVLIAIRNQLTSITSVPEIPGLIKELRRDVQTDMSTQDMVRLAPAAMGLEMRDIHTHSLDYNNLEASTSSDGQSILVPIGGNWVRLRAQIRQMLESEKG